MAGIHSRRQNLGQGMAQWQVQVTHLPDVSNCQPNADDAGSAAWPARRRPAEHLGTVRAEASERLARRGKDGHGHATLGLPNGGSRMAFGSRSVTTARPGHGRLSGRSAARRMQAAVRVSGRPGDGAPDLGYRPAPGARAALRQARRLLARRAERPGAGRSSPCAATGSPTSAASATGRKPRPGQACLPERSPAS